MAAAAGSGSAPRPRVRAARAILRSGTRRHARRGASVAPSVGSCVLSSGRVSAGAAGRAPAPATPNGAFDNTGGALFRRGESPPGDGSVPAPDLVGDLDDQAQLGALRLDGDGVAVHRAREAALRRKA